MKKTGITVISAILTALMVISMFGLMLTANNSIQSGSFHPQLYLSCACLLLTAAFGVYYILVGCKKGEGSQYYVWFMGCLAVCELVAIADAANMPVASSVALAVAVAAFTVLCFAKDLGQKKSMSFAVVALAAKVLQLILFLVAGNGFSMCIATSTLLAVVALFMVCAKYYDKNARGSK